MCRIHPTESKCRAKGLDHSMVRPAVLTVWKKSTMAFQGTDGFSVFDGKGRLVFRVDNYSRKTRCTGGALVLMDGIGRPLLTMKPQMFSMHDQWNGFEGDGGSGTKSPVPVFSMRRRSMVQIGDDAVVSMYSPKNHVWTHDFRIDGCFRRRHCKIWGGTGEVVAEISRKRVNNSTFLLSDDVFSLIIRPGHDSKLIMAFVVIMDRICQKPFRPSLCS